MLVQKTAALTFVLIRRLIHGIIPEKFGGDHITVTRPVKLFEDVAQQLFAFAVAKCIAGIEIENALRCLKIDHFDYFVLPIFGSHPYLLVGSLDNRLGLIFAYFGRHVLPDCDAVRGNA